MEQLVELDRELFLFLNNLGNPAWDDFWNFITNKFASIPFYALLVFFLYRALGWKKTLLCLVLIAAVITSTDQLSNLFKHFFERPRPCRQEGVMEYARFVAVRCGRYGYFSAHAASSAALVLFLGMILRNYWKNIFSVLIVWGLLVSYSRIYIGVHYPGDILTGWIFGILIGFLFYRLFLFLLKKYFNPSSEAGKTA
ncbi:undecaprenyl-diphosphatase [Salinimicrobium sediminis]|uniref:Undecaprenyl-diphosphatase n=1 Tax=Salinimicrobium sediminis TaxID=1343891 RepID=A0A285WZV3_9FLAO|nr:phosphatase PAP2 family protein [Salinimicrobium sediminis]SOC78617.1 undecaprenyl-diphosphatase [Salinimicrobium sediminis]